jgi:hypothetical protein
VTAPAPIPPIPKPKRQPLTRVEQVYLAALKHWFKHRGDPPSLNQLRSICRPVPSRTALRCGLVGAEAKGYCKRNKEGQFELVE